MVHFFQQISKNCYATQNVAYFLVLVKK